MNIRYIEKIQIHHVSKKYLKNQIKKCIELINVCKICIKSKIVQKLLHIVYTKSYHHHAFDAPRQACDAAPRLSRQLVA